MSSPQDPNQGQQPGWGVPQQEQAVPPTQPGWGAPPPPTQPGWGAPPPPTQPGWGAPPPQPGYPQQPAWGAPPPQQPGYPGWGQQGWAPQPARSNKKGCLIGLVIFLLAIVVLVGGCVFVIAPFVGTDLKLTQDLGSHANGVSVNWDNGVTTFSIKLAPGEQTQARNIACSIVRPDIASSSTPNARFAIYDANGVWLADDTTPCS